VSFRKVFIQDSLYLNYWREEIKGLHSIYPSQHCIRFHPPQRNGKKPNNKGFLNFMLSLLKSYPQWFLNLIIAPKNQKLKILSFFWEYFWGNQFKIFFDGKVFLKLWSQLNVPLKKKTPHNSWKYVRVSLSLKNFRAFFSSILWYLGFGESFPKKIKIKISQNYTRKNLNFQKYPKFFLGKKKRTTHFGGFKNIKPSKLYSTKVSHPPPHAM